MPVTEEPLEAAVRRMTGFAALQGKTQMIALPPVEGVRDRGRHSWEVRAIALQLVERLLRPDPPPALVDLVAACSLAHDIGHPPFGHAGERVLDVLSARCGGFESNAETVRLVHDAFGDDRLTHALVKYPVVIPARRESGALLVKGVYATQHRLVGAHAQQGEHVLLARRVVEIADDLSNRYLDFADLALLHGIDRLSAALRAAIRVGSTGAGEQESAAVVTAVRDLLEDLRQAGDPARFRRRLQARIADAVEAIAGASIATASSVAVTVPDALRRRARAHARLLDAVFLRSAANQEVEKAIAVAYHRAWRALDSLPGPTTSTASASCGCGGLSCRARITALQRMNDHQLLDLAGLLPVPAVFTYHHPRGRA